MFCSVFFFFFKQKTAYEMQRGLVGSEMCIRDRYQRRVHGAFASSAAASLQLQSPKGSTLSKCEDQDHRKGFLQGRCKHPVSYTHLTLPTILLVQISVVAVSLKKKKIREQTTSAVQKNM
eukprot:TRINITY_DN9075_c0_g1_i1.p2 TRINITY_DN9075_c0_g1~~TRINITY_DN9075_c0_g1_i1.p2  ORF type:complete len:120 (+),score=41.58 TRINITY_DN9075_c0_g1_i1:115-474(+)